MAEGPRFVLHQLPAPGCPAVRHRATTGTAEELAAVMVSVTFRACFAPEHAAPRAVPPISRTGPVQHRGRGFQAGNFAASVLRTKAPWVVGYITGSLDR
ncbi:hypothetical protein ACWGQL_35170 [Streptomyces lydicus]